MTHLRDLLMYIGINRFFFENMLSWDSWDFTCDQPRPSLMTKPSPTLVGMYRPHTYLLPSPLQSATILPPRHPPALVMVSCTSLEDT
jgi:hypothetical protein